MRGPFQSLEESNSETSQENVCRHSASAWTKNTTFVVVPGIHVRLRVSTHSQYISRTHHECAWRSSHRHNIVHILEQRYLGDFFVVPGTDSRRNASIPSDQLRVVMVALTLEPSSVPILCLAQSLCHSPCPRICVVLTSRVGDVADH